MPEQTHPKQTKNKTPADLLSYHQDHCRVRGRERAPDNTHRGFSPEALKVSCAYRWALPGAHS